MPAVLLVRHGQASFGASNYDVLSPVGHRQAELVGAALRDRIDPRIVITGTLSRQQDTARTMVEAANFETRSVVDGGWDEYDHLGMLHASAGRLRNLRTGVQAVVGNAHAVQAALDAALMAWMNSGSDVSNGLTWRQFQDGAMNSLDAAVTGEPAVVVTSGGVIAAICARLLGLDAEGFLRLNRVAVNTGITTIVSGRAGTSLLSFNEHSHLSGPERKTLLTYR